MQRSAVRQRVIADDESRMVTSRFPTPFTLVYRRSKNTEKLQLLATFWTAQRGSQAARLTQQGIAAS
jgi:hypothetical protein